MNETISTRYISKKLITKNENTSSTFLGEKVDNCSITPNGVVKATVNEKRGVVEFSKYDPEWTGEVDFNLETTDAEENKYINDYKVEFNESFAEDEEIDIDEEDDDEEIEMIPEEDDDEVETLSDEDEEETTGGATSTTYKTVYITKGKKGVSYYPAFAANGKYYCTKNFGKSFKLLPYDRLKIESINNNGKVVGIRMSRTATDFKGSVKFSTTWQNSKNGSIRIHIITAVFQ